MNVSLFSTVCLVWLVLFLCVTPPLAQDLKSLKLPKPQTEGGKPLMQALKERHSSRAFSSEELPLQVLSDMLWAACGVNRPETGRRTSPSAKNWQEIDIYVATPQGVYLFDADEHELIPILAQDIRAMTGLQPFVGKAPVNLIYVADLSRMGSASAQERDLYSATDTGFISQNVYLYSASQGLATVVRGSIDKEALAKVMKLRPDQRIILVQSVGYPPK